MRSGAIPPVLFPVEQDTTLGLRIGDFPHGGMSLFLPSVMLRKGPHAPVVQLRHPQHSDQPTGPTITPAVRAAPSQTLVAHWEHAIP